jgi:hypothetical protein
MRHAAARVREIRNLELAELCAPQRVVEQCRQDRTVALGLDGFLCRCRQKLAGLMIANFRRGAFAALGLGPLNAFDLPRWRPIRRTACYSVSANREVCYGTLHPVAG